MARASKASYAVPLALCCVLTIFFLIAATIVLALIPVYLSTRNVELGDTSPTETLSAGFASDQVGARSDSIGNTNSASRQASLALSSDTNSLSSQFNTITGIPSGNLALNQGQFISATAASKKRQFSSDTTITCERSTGLSGDILVGQFQITYPAFCLGACRKRFKTKVLKGLRNNYATFTVTIQFLIVGFKTATLSFCGLFDTSTGSCTTEAKNNAYLMDGNNTLYQFNILNYNVVSVGQITCSESSNLSAIALQRNGILWAAFQDGKLYKYNVKSKVCTATSFATNQSNFQLFSMTFLKSTVDTSETLYASRKNGSYGTLAKIDTSSYTLSVIGNYSALNETADIAGTSGGSLYGAFGTENYTIAQIQPSDAQILTQYPLNISSSNDITHTAFTIANGNFFFFEGGDNGTSIYLFNPSSNSTSLVSNITQLISGATASSCIGSS